MKDADGRLFISEGSIPTIDQSSKEVGDHEGQRMGYSWQKGSRNDTAEPGSVGGFQYFKRKDNEGFDEKPSASNKVFLMKILFNMKMSEGGFVKII